METNGLEKLDDEPLAPEPDAGIGLPSDAVVVDGVFAPPWPVVDVVVDPGVGVVVAPGAG